MRPVALLMLVALVARTSASPPPIPRWSSVDRAALAAAIDASVAEGLEPSDYDRAWIGAGDQTMSDDSRLDRAALALAHDLRDGRLSPAERADWHIARPPVDPQRWLDGALAVHDLPGAYAALLPAHAGYRALRAAYAVCHRDCAALRVNLERWRALPRDLGRRYLWVNVPAYRLDLIEDGQVVARHRVIVGKPGTRTPQFSASVRGITANPWWSVPCSIVDESIGKLVRTRPAEAARQGYVAMLGADGQLHVRQKPGPLNALGTIKLEMPNPFGVYIHDTPHRALFDRDARALSHGCIRTQNPDALARRLLSPDGARALDNALALGLTKTVPLPVPLPVYVVYLTAEAESGRPGIVRYPDLYRRDGAALAQ